MPPRQPKQRKTSTKVFSPHAMQLGSRPSTQRSLASGWLEFKDSPRQRIERIAGYVKPPRPYGRWQTEHFHFIQSSHASGDQFCFGLTRGMLHQPELMPHAASPASESITSLTTRARKLRKGIVISSACLRPQHFAVNLCTGKPSLKIRPSHHCVCTSSGNQNSLAGFEASNQDHLLGHLCATG